jgi:hypothetical protein
MYTSTGSYREVVAYVAGFDRGRLRLSAEYALKEWGREIDRFGEWLATRIGADGRGGWSVVLLGHCAGDEQLALDQLCPLYEEFMADPAYRSFAKAARQRRTRRQT